MLQQQKDCQKKMVRAIIVVFFIVGLVITFPFLLFIIIWLVFFAKVKVVDIIIDKLGIAECLKGGEGIIQRLKRLEGSPSSIKNKKQENRVNKEKNERKSKIVYKNKEIKIDRKLMNSQRRSKMKKPRSKTFQKNGKRQSDFKFGERKSIWDDYESVLNNFNK